MEELALQRLVRRQKKETPTEQLRLLGSVVEDLKSVHRAAEAIGLDDSSFAIYELLASANGSGASSASDAAREEGSVDGVRRDQAAKILAELQELAIVDWVHKEDVQRRMRQAVKRSLRGSSVPREQIESLTSKLMDLARVRLAR